MEQQQQPQPQRTATQRLGDLERALMALYQTADNMARDIGTIKDALKLLGNKVDAMVKATQRGEFMDDAVLTKIMIENNIEELKNKVDQLISQGFLAKNEEVTANSFIVGREVDEKGEVANPRLQFALSALAEPVRLKILGAKPGQLLELQEGKLKFEVLESYTIQTPKQPEEAPVDELEAADAAMAAEQAAAATQAAAPAGEVAPAPVAEAAPVAGESSGS